jgi:hypothetical protein
MMRFILGNEDIEDFFSDLKATLEQEIWEQSVHVTPLFRLIASTNYTRAEHQLIRMN